MDYGLLNGLLLPDLAHSAISHLVHMKRFHNVDQAILEGLRLIIEQNAPLLIQSDEKWTRLLGKMNESFQNIQTAKPDQLGTWNLQVLNQMYDTLGHN